LPGVYEAPKGQAPLPVDKGACPLCRRQSLRAS
jgi:hypothetical protein